MANSSTVEQRPVRLVDAALVANDQCHDDTFVFFAGQSIRDARSQQCAAAPDQIGRSQDEFVDLAVAPPFGPDLAIGAQSRLQQPGLVVEFK